MAAETPVACAIFPQFSKLPTEIRYKIWHLTLKPQIVEIRYYSPQDTTDADYDCWQDLSGSVSRALAGSGEGLGGYLPSWEVRFFSTAALPTAFYVCNDSRRAIMPFYPVCFASESSPASIHFNFALDTLYIDTLFAQLIDRFLDRLTQHERQNLRHLALSEECASPDLLGDSSHEKFWLKVETALIGLPELENFGIAIMIWRELRYYESVPESIVDGYRHKTSHQIEFFHELPDEVKADLEMLGEDDEDFMKPCLSYELTREIELRAKCVFGWSRAPPPEYI